MKIQHPAPEDSLTLAMIELDLLETERLAVEVHRNELRATTRRQAHAIRALELALRAAWPRSIARQRRQASREHQRSRAYRGRLIAEFEREHEDRLAELARQNTERRMALTQLERERVAERPARVALAWLTPVFAAGLVAAFGFILVHEQPHPARASVAPMTAIAEPSSESVPIEDRLITVSDAPAVTSVPESVTVPVPTAKPSKSVKPTKPVAKPVTKPVTKPRAKPIVLGGGDDPLGDL